MWTSMGILDSVRTFSCSGAFKHVAVGWFLSFFFRWLSTSILSSHPLLLLFQRPKSTQRVLKIDQRSLPSIRWCTPEIASSTAIHKHSTKRHNLANNNNHTFPTALDPLPPPIDSWHRSKTTKLTNGDTMDKVQNKPH